MNMKSIRNLLTATLLAAGALLAAAAGMSIASAADDDGHPARAAARHGRTGGITTAGHGTC